MNKYIHILLAVALSSCAGTAIKTESQKPAISTATSKSSSPETTSSYKTIIGDVKFTGSENTATPGTVSQWQNGEFEVVWPPKLATAKLNAQKPAWR